MSVYINPKKDVFLKNNGIYIILEITYIDIILFIYAFFFSSFIRS